MYAILQHGGHQYRVASGDRILVDRIPVEVGSTVTLESVLLIGDGAETDVAKGSPVEASVTATVIAHRRGRKIRVFTYKPKKRHRRTLGYRSQLTELRIDEVGRGKAKPKASAPKAAAAPKANAPKAGTAAKAGTAPKAAKPEVIEAAAEAIAQEAEAIAVEAEAVEAEVAVAELAVEEAVAADAVEPTSEKPAAPKRARTPKPKKDPEDGA
jgi:large subunit ribosomal protein L21